VKGDIHGAPLYIAPERFAADPLLDHHCDIYYLGAVLYELLTGRPPFIAADVRLLVVAILTEAPAATPHGTARGAVPALCARDARACARSMEDDACGGRARKGTGAVHLRFGQPARQWRDSGGLRYCDPGRPGDRASEARQPSTDVACRHGSTGGRQDAFNLKGLSEKFSDYCRPR